VLWSAPRRKLAVEWLSVFRWRLLARMTQESPFRKFIHPSTLVVLCVLYIVARSLRLTCTLLFSARSTVPSARLQKL